MALHFTLLTECPVYEFTLQICAFDRSYLVRLKWKVSFEMTEIIAILGGLLLVHFEKDELPPIRRYVLLLAALLLQNASVLGTSLIRA